ncbi:MAG: IclR family transcriptional regulator [Sulfurospirillaceae bacterium]|nr:IclR family transcriptional regulator [Sulfurospirillaceae bacterium]MDD2825680.1 IclR family transcriptional regulator [Sulfurospirillaceae bacterium]
MQSQNKSLSKGLLILKEVITSSKPVTANALCQKFDIDKSTMSRLITTLQSEDFIEYKDNTKEIILSDLMRKIVLKDDREKIISKTQILLDDIFSLTNESSYIGIYDNNAVLYLNQVDKSNRVLKTRNAIGLHAPLHTNAFGKILIAYLGIDCATLELKHYTSNTITTVSKMNREVERIKTRGYAIGNEEHEFGLKSLAIPYFNSKKEFVGAIGISGLAIRMDERTLHQFGEQLIQLNQ